MTRWRILVDTLVSAVKGERSPRMGWSLLVIALALTSAPVLWSLWANDVFLLHDGPQHVMLGHLENVYDASGSRYQLYLERGAPISSRGFSELFEPLDRWLGWRTALRCSLTLALLLWMVGFAVLVATLHRRRLWLALLASATAMQWSVYMGFWSFMIANGFGFLVIAWAASRKEPTVVRSIGLGALLLLQAIMHTFSAMLTGVFLLALVMSRPRRARGLATLVVVSLPAAIVAVASAMSQDEAMALQFDFPPMAWLSLGDQIYLFHETLAVGPFWRSLPAALMGLAGVVAGIAVGRVEDPEKATLPTFRPLAGAAAVLMLAGMVMPINTESWQFLSPRFLPLGLMLGAACFPLERLRATGARALVAAALVTYALSSNTWAAYCNARLGQASADALSGLDAPLRRSGARLPIVLDSALIYGNPEQPWRPFPYFQPARNLGQLYATEQGGLTAYNFMSSWSLHNFVLRPGFTKIYPEVPDYRRWDKLGFSPTYPSKRRASIVTEITRDGRDYEDVILLGAPADADIFIERGYVTDFRQGGAVHRPLRGL